MGHSKQCNFLLITVHVHCTYYEAQEDTSQRSGIDRGRFRDSKRSYQKMTCVARVVLLKEMAKMSQP